MTANHDAFGIVNARGVPGTVACLARDRHDGRRVLLTTQHVLFGHGARECEPIWRLNECRSGRPNSPVGRSLWGRIGSIEAEGGPCFVDCAIGSWAGNGAAGAPGLTQSRNIGVGQIVSKIGAGSGKTIGVIDKVNVLVSQGPSKGGLHAPGQLVVRPHEDDRPFAGAGDSGALVVDEDGCAVGLVWGVNTRGEGLVAPIGAVLRALNISLDRTITPADLKEPRA
jgi:hypothetical protein